MPRPVYLDCDTGVDDALALAYLLASPEIELVGIGSVSGNVDAGSAAENTLALLALAGRGDVPVAVGAHDPLAGAYVHKATVVHGENGIGGVDLPPHDLQPVGETATEMLLRLSREHEGSLEIIAVGPLTNLALALRADDSFAGRVASVTVMGGAALVPGNVTAVAEANINGDPEAAAVVIAADWDLLLVPLDVTLEHALHEDDRQRLLSDDSALVRTLGEILDHYFDFYVRLYGTRSCALHDPLAAALAVGGAVATRAPAVPVTVDDTAGPGRGQTICDLRGPRSGVADVPGCRTRVVLEVEDDLAPHLVERILTL